MVGLRTKAALPVYTTPHIKAPAAPQDFLSRRLLLLG